MIEVIRRDVKKKTEQRIYQIIAVAVALLFIGTAIAVIVMS